MNKKIVSACFAILVYIAACAPASAHTLKVDVDFAKYWLVHAGNAINARKPVFARGCVNNALYFINDAKYHNYHGAVAGLEALANHYSAFLKARGH
jgi:hypothetical protein